MSGLTALSLSRTLLLMRDEMNGQVSDGKLLDALTSTVVVLVADEANLSSHSAQSAYATAAMLMARSGHQVHLLAPDVRLVAPQAPLIGDRLVTALVAASDNLVPGVQLSGRLPTTLPDLEVRFGDSGSRVHAARSIVLSASAWSGAIVDAGSRWPNTDWPFGGLAAGALGATEAFKAAMTKLSPEALKREEFGARFAPCLRVRVQIAPEDTPLALDLGMFDVISGGAIANCFLFSLLRIRGATGYGKIIDFDKGDISNLNRNMLMLYSDMHAHKVDFLASYFTGGLRLEPIAARYPLGARSILPPSPKLIVGVDHIPTRWVAQGSNPKWLGIGATSHWSAMTSFHVPGLPCARCLHAEDDPTNGPIPTVSFVSFWAGLLLAGYFVRGIAMRDDPHAQQIYLTPLRAELPWTSGVGRRADCPLCAKSEAASLAA